MSVYIDIDVKEGVNKKNGNENGDNE